MSAFSHINQKGLPAMVDVSNKHETVRKAKAIGIVQIPSEIAKHFVDKELHSPKGPVFQTAIIAGTQAVKNTSSLIPFCHPLIIDAIQFHIDLVANKQIEIICTVTVTGKTGVEMEALTGCAAAALTVYDMCKALTHDMVIHEIRLLEKTGGKSDFKLRH